MLAEKVRTPTAKWLAFLAAVATALLWIGRAQFVTAEVYRQDQQSYQQQMVRHAEFQSRIETEFKNINVSLRDIKESMERAERRVGVRGR